jgi:UDP-N-acetylglucosamine transferase subunit ALG13
MPNTTWVELMPFDEMKETMTRAAGVVCHAGTGTIMTALQTGHTPVVVPRRVAHGEHVDDHQLDIAERFAARGLVACVTTETDLAPLLTPRTEGEGPAIGKGSAALRGAIAEAVASGRRRHVRGSLRR